MNNIPRGWERVNDSCIGVLNENGPGYLYAVSRYGLASNYTWEAVGPGGVLGIGLPSMEAAVQACRDDYKARKVAA